MPLRRLAKTYCEKRIVVLLCFQVCSASYQRDDIGGKARARRLMLLYNSELLFKNPFLLGSYIIKIVTVKVCCRTVDMVQCTIEKTPQWRDITNNKPTNSVMKSSIHIGLSNSLQSLPKRKCASQLLLG